MKDIQTIVADIQSVFEESAYPQDFLAAYDQMECLASSRGRETFLVRRKVDGLAAVAKCYDREEFPLRPDTDLLRSFDAPGLPRYFEEFCNEKKLCVVREYIEGTPLSQYARETQLTREDILSVALQLCDILEGLHGRTPPVVHRDIKPENIIIRPDKSIVLIDFDISRAVKENARADTVFFGTKGYAPPEQYGFGQTDCRADIYAFGVLLRFLVTGSVQPNRNIRMDAVFQRVIDRCTAFSPDDRPQQVGQVREMLKEKAGKPGLSARRLLGFLLAALLLLGAGFALGRLTDRAQPAPTVFSEPMIEQAVRDQLGLAAQASIPREALAQVRRIYIFGTETFADPDGFYRCSVDHSTRGTLKSLNDLTLLPNLEDVHIVYQGDLDVAALAALQNLQTVEIKHSRISSIAPIAAVQGLKNAILFDTGLSDVTPLQLSPALEGLDIGLNPIPDMAHVGSHPAVRSLTLRWLRMDSLDGIENLPQVRAVSLQEAEIGDLSALKNLKKLETVYVLKAQEAAVRELLKDREVQIVVTEN